MPPRKSVASTAAPTSPTTAGNADVSMLSTTSAAEPKSPTTKKSGSKQQDDSSIGIEDLLLPRSLTSRLARGVLPANTSLQKDAVLALTKSATVFISYLASHANEQRPSAKTVTPADVLNALKEIEMGGIMDVGKVDEEGKPTGRLERELVAYEEIVKGKRKGYRDKVKARESGVSAVEEDGGVERGEPEMKRVRRSSGDEEVRGNEQNGEEEDALLDAQLNGTALDTGNDDTELEEPEDEHDDEEEGDDEGDEVVEDEEQDDTEADEEDIDRIDVEDEPAPGRRVSSRSNKGWHSMLSPNGRAEVGSEDESD